MSPLGHFTQRAQTEEQMRVHRSPEGSESASGPPPSPPRAAPGAALGWPLFAACFPPTLSPHVSVSREKFLTLQQFCSCPCPGPECPPCLSPGGLSGPQKGFRVSCPHEASIGSCCLVLGCLPLKRSVSLWSRSAGAIGWMFYLPLNPAFLSQWDPWVPRGQDYTLELFPWPEVLITAWAHSTHQKYSWESEEMSQCHVQSQRNQQTGFSVYMWLPLFRSGS